MTRDAMQRIDDALTAGHALQGYVARSTRDQFLASRSQHLIFERLFEIAAEALNQARIADPEVLPVSPESDAVAALGNRILQGDYEVSRDILWDVAAGNVSGMCNALEQLRETTSVP